MRTKTLLLTAVLSAAGIASSLAQGTVYSVNAVGYVNLVVPVGLSMVANPLDAGSNNTLGSLFPNVPNFSNFYKFTGTSFDIATFAFGAWDKPNITLNPGEGGFIGTTTLFTNTFVGEVKQGTLSTPIPVGLSIVSSQVPQTGAIDTTLGLTNLSMFDNVFKFNVTSQSYDIYTVTPGGGWSGPGGSTTAPSLNVAESVFISAGAAVSWNRTFSVNQ